MLTIPLVGLCMYIVGDISPREEIPKEEKGRLETVRPRMLTTRSSTHHKFDQQEAMHNFIHDMLHTYPAALRMEALWEVRLTPSVFFLRWEEVTPCALTGIRARSDPRGQVRQRLACIPLHSYPLTMSYPALFRSRQT